MATPTPDARQYGAEHAHIYDDLYRSDHEHAARLALLRALTPDGAILELGVGTGRIALPLARAGLRMWGVDCSPEMLGILRDKDPEGLVRIIEGDFTELERVVATRRFAVVAATMSVLYGLATLEAQRRAVAGAFAILEPGGHFVVDAWLPRTANISSRTGHAYERTIRMGCRVSVSLSIDTENQRVNHLMLITEPGRAPDELRRSDRYIPVVELDQMAIAAGFTVAGRWADYAKSSFRKSSDQHVSVYRKPPRKLPPS